MRSRQAVLILLSTLLAGVLFFGACDRLEKEPPSTPDGDPAEVERSDRDNEDVELGVEEERTNTDGDDEVQDLDNELSDEDGQGERDCQACGEDDACPEDRYCAVYSYPGMCLPMDGGCCVFRCGPQHPCEEGKHCNAHGRCVTGEENCGDSCPSGYVCDPVYNQCTLNCPLCGPGECCDANSAPHCYSCSCHNPVVCGVLMPACCSGYCCSAVVYGSLGYCI